MQANVLAIRLLVMIVFVTSSTAGPFAEPGAPGFLPPNAKPHGYSLTELATAYAAWGFGTSEAENPLIALRCEQSPINRKIWFLPVSLVDGESEATCHIPQGSFLVVFPGGYECSEAEGNGSTEAELEACVEEGFDTVVDAEVTLDGTTVSSLNHYIVTTEFDVLPADNLLGPDPTPTMTKGYFLVHTPLSRGTHTLRTVDEFSDGFRPRLTLTIIVP
jgi:hypothetical protein